MTIKANIEEKIAQLQKEKAQIPPGAADQIGPRAKELKDLAIAAILGDKGAFIAYMKLFAKSPDELARLTATDGTEKDPIKREARAYLVSNAVCAPGTTTGLNDNVFDLLDVPPAA